MTPIVPRRVLDLLARTSSDAESLGLLIHGQHTRRLLMLRWILDATAAAGPDVRARFRDHWDLVEAAEQTGSAGRDSVHRSLQHPLVGPWARQALACLTSGRPADLETFGSVAAAAAVRAELPFRMPLTAGDHGLHLPGLGTLTCAPGTTADVRYDGSVLRLRTGTETAVCPQPGYGAWCGSPAWQSAYALPPLTPEGCLVPLDDQRPYRNAPALGIHAVRLDDAGRKRWYEAWTDDVPRLLGYGRAHQPAETEQLLLSLVPVTVPPEADRHGYCSGTRRDAFGCMYSSMPPGPLGVAELLVHETQHAKLAALTDLVTLHHAPADARYFAPWRPDPRPLDGLWQGLYSQMALAFWWQGCVQNTPDGPRREHSWTEYAHRREQVTAALGQLVGSPHLTCEGRRFADGMVAALRRLDDLEPPRHHTLRARAYVATSRELWKQRLR